MGHKWKSQKGQAKPSQAKPSQSQSCCRLIHSLLSSRCCCWAADGYAEQRQLMMDWVVFVVHNLLTYLHKDQSNDCWLWPPPMKDKIPLSLLKERVSQ
jgi:hypothetical protein